jgi:hypothetical protein
MLRPIGAGARRGRRAARAGSDARAAARAGAIGRGGAAAGSAVTVRTTLVRGAGGARRRGAHDRPRHVSRGDTPARRGAYRAGHARGAGQGRRGAEEAAHRQRALGRGRAVHAGGGCGLTALPRREAPARVQAARRAEQLPKHPARARRALEPRAQALGRRRRAERLLERHHQAQDLAQLVGGLRTGQRHAQRTIEGRPRRKVEAFVLAVSERVEDSVAEGAHAEP